MIWILALVIGLPLVIAMWAAFFLFVFFPAQHVLNVWRMDAKTAKLWETAEAQVVTISAQIASDAGVDVLENQIICYDGYFARPLSLKAGAPTAGESPRSVGVQALIGEFPTGGILDMDFSLLCNRVQRGGIGALAQGLEPRELHIVAPTRDQYCKFNPRQAGRSEVLRTEGGWVSNPEIKSLRTRPLREVATLADLGTTDSRKTPTSFSRRWGWSPDRKFSIWSAEEQCWKADGRTCDDELTRICGGKPG